MLKQDTVVGHVPPRLFSATFALFKKKTGNDDVPHIVGTRAYTRDLLCNYVTRVCRCGHKI